MSKKIYNNAKVCVGGAISYLDKYLIVYKPKRKWWEFAGGKVDHGETLTKAVEREMFEETGFDVKAGAVVGVYSYPLKEGNSMVYLKFACEFRFPQTDIPVPKLSSEHTKYQWLTTREILKIDNISPILRNFAMEESEFVFDINPFIGKSGV